MLHYSMLNYTNDNAAQGCFSNCTFWNVTSTSNSCIKHLASFCYDELLKKKKKTKKTHTHKKHKLTTVQSNQSFHNCVHAQIDRSMTMEISWK